MNETQAAKPMGDPVDAEAVRAELKRILADPLFSKSRRCSNLLAYIVEKTLEGGVDLKERALGVAVLGKDTEYDPSQDPAVRVAAAEIRKRLVLHYNDAPPESELRIELPAYSYAAEFKFIEAKQAPAQLVAAVPEASTRGRARYWYLIATLLAVLVGLAAWGIHHLHPHQTALDKFWNPILQQTGQVLLGVSSPPSAVAITQSASSPDSVKPPVSFDTYMRQRTINVNMSDVTAANDLAAYLQSHKKASVVRPANSLSMWELRTNPVVFFGIFDSYWPTKLGADSRFRLNRDDHGRRWIEDVRNPGDRKWVLDMTAPMDQVDSDYALISRTLDPSTGQWWIGVAGLTDVSMLAAHQMMIDPEAMQNAVASLPDGWEQKNLQIVLRIKMIKGNPGGAQVASIVAW